MPEVGEEHENNVKELCDKFKSLHFYRAVKILNEIDISSLKSLCKKLVNNINLLI